jgi:hypothetical protein
MIKQLTRLASHLDSIGLRKEADYIDGVITKVHGKGPDEAGGEPAFDLFIDNKGKAVGAEPASGDLGSTCIINEESPKADDESSLELGDFSNLGDTNIDHDEAFSAGCSVCGNKDKACGHDHNEGSSYMAKPQLSKIKEYSSKLYDMMEADEGLSDWMEAYIAQMDHMMGAVYHSYKHSGGHSDEGDQADYVEQMQAIQGIAGDELYGKGLE